MAWYILSTLLKSNEVGPHERLGAMPYATIIIPTHNRPFTLEASVRSAQRQTVADIEILIVGDGVDPETRQLANALASEDPRIRFVDNPKGERSGVAHRHGAVLGAAADRIFYNDDDDLLLPSHVEKLGAALDAHDFAESLPASVTHSRHIEVALANHGSALARSELAKRRLKMTYDTHVSHLKSAYLGLGAPWLSNEGDLAWSFLEKFALSGQIRWASVAEVTALSFHGLARRGYTPDERRQELASFEASLGTLDPSCFRFGWYIQFLNLHKSQLWGDSSEETFRLLDFCLKDKWDGEARSLQIALTEQQLEEIESVFDFYRGRSVPEHLLGKLLLQLSQSIQGGTPLCRRIASLAARYYGVNEVIQSLERLNCIINYEHELSIYLLFFLLQESGDASAAMEVMRRLDGHPCIHGPYKDALMDTTPKLRDAGLA